MSDNWLKTRYVDRIFIEDWPLTLLDQWIKTLYGVDNFILPEVCQMFIATYNTGLNIDHNYFRNHIVRKSCSGRSICNYSCIDRDQCGTAAYIKQRLVDLDHLTGLVNFRVAQREILANFFDKITFGMEVPKSKTRIGILLFPLKLPIQDEFIKCQNDVIVKQLAAKYYVMTASSVMHEDLFKHIKRSIDVVVIVVDANMCVDAMYDVVAQFQYLTIILVKAADAHHTEAVKAHYLAPFPKNCLEIYDWLDGPNELTAFVSNCMVPMKRLSVALQSMFVRQRSKN